jgi:apolipoprotein D and lipocalin family protein
MALRFYAAVVIVVFGGLSAACVSAGQPLKTAARVDLPRYMGDWHVIANIPNLAEKGCVDSVESYALRPDGDIDNWFTCRKKSFEAPMKRKATAVAKVTDTTTNVEWSVRFLKILSVRYLVLDLDPDYQWVVVGHPSRRYGWVMARAKTLPDSTYQDLLHRLADHGYDPTKFERVPQR